jgi:hypothetical protein
MMVVVGNAVPVTAGRNVLLGPVCLLPATTSSVARTDAGGTAVNADVVKNVLLEPVNLLFAMARSADQMGAVEVAASVIISKKNVSKGPVSVFPIVLRKNVVQMDAERLVVFASVLRMNVLMELVFASLTAQTNSVGQTAVVEIVVNVLPLKNVKMESVSSSFGRIQHQD